MAIKFENREYTELLKIISALSRLFSEGKAPYMNYRIAENIFCRAFGAKNLARKDSSYDATIDEIGVGLKTFLLKSDNSLEKVAEFNSISSTLRELKGKKLAIEVAKARNSRINSALRLYNVKEAIYHCVGRKDGVLEVFENDYLKVDLGNIKMLKSTNSNIVKFEDQHYEYSYNISKSTLYKRFTVGESSKIEIEIVDDPFELLLNLKDDLFKKEEAESFDYVVLPLYSTQSKSREVAEKSGLNQWNAGGRQRDYGEVYIPNPADIRNKYPDFFPSRDTPFKLEIPTGEIFEAKICQQDSKALMTNPNKALSEWLLRTILNLKEGKLATREHLDYLGVDSVIVTKKEKDYYTIDVMPVGSYEKFIDPERSIQAT
ncbi:phospholipase D-like domain-containing protein [Gracilimonas halophila]|uniref:Restriction endonuclease n=1 Tax=Gracilimonas halophila TaxID=1834464 RepID=A0ABW5JIG1_9BACT